MKWYDRETIHGYRSSSGDIVVKRHRATVLASAPPPVQDKARVTLKPAKITWKEWELIDCD